MDHAAATGAAPSASKPRVIGGIDESELHLLIRRVMQDVLESDMARLGGFESRLRQGFSSVDERLEAMGLRIQQKVDVSMLESHASKTEMALQRKLDAFERRAMESEESQSNQLQAESRKLMERLEELSCCVRLKADADQVNARLAERREDEAARHTERQNAMVDLRHGLLEELEARCRISSEQVALKADAAALEIVTSELQDLRELSKSIQFEAASIQSKSAQFWESSQKMLDGKIEGLERRFDNLRTTLEGQLALKASSSETENRFEGVTCQLANKAEVSDIENRFEEIAKVGKSALANKIWNIEKQVSSLEGAIAMSLPTGRSPPSNGLVTNVAGLPLSADGSRTTVATERGKQPQQLAMQGVQSPIASEVSTPTTSAISPGGRMGPRVCTVTRQDSSGGLVRSSSVPGLQARNRASPTHANGQFFPMQQMGNSPNSASPLSLQPNSASPLSLQGPLGPQQPAQLGGYPQGPLGAPVPVSNRPHCGLGALWR